MTDSMIQLDDLEFSWPDGDFRLHLPNLTIPRCTSVAITGASGSGKTTLLNLIAGILLPTSGRITVAGTEITGLSESDRRAFRLRNIGLVFQSFELIDYLNVLDNVLLPARINRVLPLTSALRDRARMLMDRTGLAQYTRRSVTRLSQGERQRVAICRALLPNPSLVLADEPTGNLDPETTQRILDILLQVKDHNATLVMVSHDHSLLDAFDTTVEFSQFATGSATASGFSGDTTGAD